MMIIVYKRKEIKINKMKKIQLTQGKVALVDDEDLAELSKFKWCASKIGNTFYAIRNLSTEPRRTILMHREILKTPKNLETDHRDGNGLNNQKENLRVATRSQNLQNRGKYKNNSSGYKGVYWNKIAKKWIVRIKIKNNNIYLGCFPDKIKAHKAYITACKKYHGDFACVER